MARSLAAMRAEVRDLLNELGTNGLLTLAASVCREEEMEARSKLAASSRPYRAQREVDVQVWQGRLAQVEMLQRTLVASFSPKREVA